MYIYQYPTNLIKKFLALISIVVLLFTSNWIPLYAAPPACEDIEDRQEQLICIERLYQRDGVNFLDESACSPGSPSNCSPCTGTGGVPQGSNNQERLYRFLVAQGLTPAQSAGITGAIMVESTPLIDPYIIGGGGNNYRGIAQWDIPGRWAALVRWAQENGRNALDPEPSKAFDTQVEYMWKEAGERTNGPNGETNIDGIKRYDDVPHAAWYWGRFFEVAIIGGSTSTTPLTNVQELQKRIEYGNGVLQLYGDGTGGSSSTGCAGTESGKVIDGFVLYSQSDQKWANKPYGNGPDASTIAVAGCGPSSVAMAIATLTNDRSVTPETIAASYGQYYVPGEGSSWDLMNNVPGDFGLTSQDIKTDIEAAKAAIRNGALVIASGKGPKPFTTGGHIIVLRGITDDGKIMVGDPGHRDTSEVPHEESALIGSIKNMWVISK